MAESTFVVSGPGYERGKLPSIGAALVAGQNAASRHDANGTWYVRAADSNQALYRVERHGGTIYTVAVGHDG